MLCGVTAQMSGPFGIRALEHAGSPLARLWVGASRTVSCLHMRCPSQLSSAPIAMATCV